MPQATKTQILDHTEPGEYVDGQGVDLVIKSQTDMGYKAIVNGKHWGVIYFSEIFQNIEKNQTLKGYIKKIREDGKLDLSLYKTGHLAADEIRPKILAQLEAAGGFLKITDKTPPEIIYKEFGVSKKKFKIAVGQLYKQQLIAVETEGLRRIQKNKHEGL